MKVPRSVNLSLLATMATILCKAYWVKNRTRILTFFPVGSFEGFNSPNFYKEKSCSMGAAEYEYGADHITYTCIFLMCDRISSPVWYRAPSKRITVSERQSARSRSSCLVRCSKNVSITSWSVFACVRL